MRKIALLLSFFAAPALGQTYPPQALTFIGYGQSTMEGTVSGDAIGFTASFSGGVMNVTSITGTPLYVGAIISCYNLTINPVTSIQRFGSGVGGRGTYHVNNSDSLGPASCLTSTSTAQTLITPSNINSNAFMIATSPQATVRGMWGTLAPGNSNTKPVLLSNWTGLALLKETVSPYNWNVSNGAIDTETPMSSFVAQFIAQTGFSAPNAVVAENMAHGGEDWVASYPNILGPGGYNDWTNFVSAQKFIKNYVQSNSTIAGTFTGGPWKYHLGGIIMRLGESAAAAASLVAGARPPSTSSTSFLVTASPPSIGGVTQPVSGWCVYDAGKGAFLGYAASWVGTTFTLQANSLANGSAADPIYISPCYPGFLAELKSMVAELNASDISDAREPGGVPIFAAVASSWNFGGAQRYYQFAINAAYVAEALVDPRMVVTGPSFIGPYQSDLVHGEPQENAIVGAYQGKWAAWRLSGKRTPPFAMISAQRLGAGSVDGNRSHYGVRVTFQMPPSPPCVAPGSKGMSCTSSVTTAQQQVMQFYTQANRGTELPAIANYGFCYLDGPYPAGGWSFAMFTPGTTGSCLASASGISIAGLPILATSNSYTAGGAAKSDRHPAHRRFEYGDKSDHHARRLCRAQWSDDLWRQQRAYLRA